MEKVGRLGVSSRKAACVDTKVQKLEDGLSHFSWISSDVLCLLRCLQFKSSSGCKKPWVEACIKQDLQKFNKSGLKLKPDLELTWINGAGSVCRAGGRINRRHFRLDVMMQGSKLWRSSFPPPPTVSTLHIWTEGSGCLISHTHQVLTQPPCIHTLRCSESPSSPGSGNIITNGATLTHFLTLSPNK